MFNENQTRRIAKHAASALITAIDMFADMVERSEPEDGARVVADIIKTQLARPEHPTDPTADLRTALRAAMLPPTTDQQ